MRKKIVIILPIELQKKANNYCGEFSDGGENTFVVLLSENGKEPFTHTISSWLMTKAEEFAIKLKYEQYMYYEPNTEELLNQLKLKHLIVDYTGE